MCSVSCPELGCSKTSQLAERNVSLGYNLESTRFLFKTSGVFIVSRIGQWKRRAGILIVCIYCPVS